MVHFVEPLVTQQLWYWLESERGWQVDSEVDTGNGRIDLACKTTDGQYVGIEVKAGSGLSWGAQLSEQVWRYVDSGLFDAVYFASPSVEKVATRLDSTPVEPLIPVVSQASRKLRAGIQEGHYDAETVLDRIEHDIDDAILSHEFSNGRRTVRSYIQHHLEERTERSLDPITLDAGIRELSRSVFPSELGLIEVPIPLQGGYLRSPRMALTPGESHDPTFVREAGELSRADDPTFAPQEEPWVRHAVWREFGGLPEGSIPNVMESERVDRPIDLVAFDGSWDPTAIYAEPETGEVIGVEAKGVGSYAPNRVTRQLVEFLETGVFSRLHLAVPTAIVDRAEELVDEHDDLSDSVGILAVNERGIVSTVRDAPALDLRYDGYEHGTEVYKTGYGDIRLPNGQDVTAPFVLSEWRDPLTDDDGEPVVWDYDPRTTKYVIHDIEALDVTEPTAVSQQLKPQARTTSTARAYLLTGYSADPYANGQGNSEEERRQPKYGYVRLSVRDFETDEGEYGLDLHFGRGSWEGGYICLLGDQVDALVSVLSSLEHVESGRIPGQGKYIDLETFRWEYGENYEFRLAGEESGSEQLLDLEIEAKRTDDGIGARLRIGDQLTQGVEVTMTETQRIDFLRTLRIMRYGRPSELPGDGSGYQRVGPDGTDTWDRGTAIEKEHGPDELERPSSDGNVETDDNTDAGAIEYVTPTRSFIRRRLQAMEPADFEQFVADLWKTHLGWTTHVVGKPGDRGIDIVATTDDGEKQLIQAKRYGPDTTVGSPEIQQYASLRLQEDNVDQVLIVTTGTFSRQAEDMAPELDVVLVDGQDLLDLIDHLDAWDVVAAYFEDIDLASESSRGDETEREHDGVLDRIRSWFE